MITVFGSTGFIGAHLTSHLRAQGHVVATPGRKEIEGGTLPHDLGDVFYCLGSDDWKNPKGLMDANFSIMKALVDGHRYGQFIYLSSSRIYLNAAATSETAPLTVDFADPGALYNVSKISAESYCLSHSNQNIKVVRLSNVVGFAPEANFFLPVLTRNALLNNEIRFTIGAGSAKDYVSIADVVAFLARLRGPTRHRLYNFASGRNTTAGAIAERLVGLTGCRVVWQGGADIRFPPIVLDRFREEFGPVPDFDPVGALDAIVEMQRRWFVENGRALA